MVMEDVNREMGVKYIEAFFAFSIVQTSPKIERKKKKMNQ